MNALRRSLLFFLGVTASTSLLAQMPLPPAPAGVQTSTSYGVEFSKIGSPGNRPVSQTEAPELYPPFSFPATPFGSVNNEFRVSRTEITASRWLDFVRAYAPYHASNGSPFDPLFTSDWVNVTPNGSGQIPTYSVPMINASKPVEVGWDFAARYCNWLTNGQRADRMAFETGAYNLQNITVTNGHLSVVPSRLPTATYWLTSVDEWSKAAFYDPSRYGIAQEGYWAYPNGTNNPLLAGWPEQGGQTDAGIPYGGPSGDTRFNDVASYGSVQSPWGLFDLSGGSQEWTDSLAGPLDDFFLKGTQRYEFAPFVSDRDRISWLNSAYSLSGYGGIRLASNVPAPSAMLPIGLLALRVRRIRHDEDHSRCLGNRGRIGCGTFCIRAM